MVREQLVFNVSSLWPVSEVRDVDFPSRFAEAAGYEGGIMEMPRRRLLRALRSDRYHPQNLAFAQRGWIEDRSAEPEAGLLKPSWQLVVDRLFCLPWGITSVQVDEVQKGLETLKPDIQTAINWNLPQIDFSDRVKRPVLKYFRQLNQTPPELVSWATGDRRLGHAVLGKGEELLEHYTSGEPSLRSEALSSLLGVTDIIFVPLGANEIEDIFEQRTGALSRQLTEVQSTPLPDGGRYSGKFVIEMSPTQFYGIAREQGALKMHRKITEYLLGIPSTGQ